MRQSQRGITLVVVTIALFSLLVVAGLALDIGHVMVNKARLQATVDAAALSAAKVLDVTGSTDQASTAANNVFRLNARNHPDLWSVVGDVRRTVDYSSTLVPFAGGTSPPLYVRIKASGFTVGATLASVAGINTFNLAATAIAGPSSAIPTACNITPILMCGGASTPAAPIFGYSSGEITVLKYGGGAGGQGLGPGNYGLLDVGNGASGVGRGLAGSFANCATIGNRVTTENGAAPRPVAQGLNTRFNEYSGSLGGGRSTFPPDVITTQPSGTNRLSCSDPSCTSVVAGAPSQSITNASQYDSWSYEGMYQPRLRNQNYDIAPPTGIPDRRILAVPVGNCTGGGGRSSVNVVGLACVFLLQDVDSGDADIFGEVLSSCQVNGNAGPAPNNGPGPYIIQLYHVDGSPES